MNKIHFTVTGKLTPLFVKEKYAALLFKEVKQKISRAPSYENTIAIVAYEEDKEIALLATGIVKGLPAADIISLFVVEEYRKKGLASALITLLEQTLAKINIRQVNAVYQDDWEGIPAFEKIIHHAQWQSPEKKFELCKIDLKKTGLEREWISAGSLPENVKLVVWSSLTLEEKQAQAALCSVPFLSPFQMENNIAFNSLAAYIDNVPAGYLVTHRIKEDIQYTALFVKDCFLQGLLAAHLINSAALMQFKEKSYGVALMIDTANAPMLLYSKRFRRLLHYHQYVYTSYKKI